MTQRFSGEVCRVQGSPHEGELVTLKLYSFPTGCWDCVLASGREVPIKSSRLRPVERTAPIQKQFMDWGKA